MGFLPGAGQTGRCGGRRPAAAVALYSPPAAGADVAPSTKPARCPISSSPMIVPASGRPSGTTLVCRQPGRRPRWRRAGGERPGRRGGPGAWLGPQLADLAGWRRWSSWRELTPERRGDHRLGTQVAVGRAPGGSTPTPSLGGWPVEPTRRGPAFRSSIYSATRASATARPMAELPNRSSTSRRWACQSLRTRKCGGPSRPKGTTGGILTTVERCRGMRQAAAIDVEDGWPWGGRPQIAGS